MKALQRICTTDEFYLECEGYPLIQCMIKWKTEKAKSFLQRMAG